MGQLHVASQIDRRTACGRGDIIDRQLAFAIVGIDAARARPKSAEQRILAEPWQQIVDNGGDRIVPAQSQVKRFRCLWHKESSCPHCSRPAESKRRELHTKVSQMPRDLSTCTDIAPR